MYNRYNLMNFDSPLQDVGRLDLARFPPPV
jgi:hypothetical protein